GYFPALLRALEYTSRLARTNASNLIAARTTSGRLSGCGNVLLRQQPRAAREVARHLLRAIRVLLTEFFAERVLRRPGVRALVRERAVRRQRHAHVEQKVRDVAGDVLLTVFLTGDYDATDFVSQPRFPGLEYLVVQLVESFDHPLHQRRLNPPPDGSREHDDVGSEDFLQNSRP